VKKSRYAIALAVVGALAIGGLGVIGLAQTGKPDQQKWPPQFPRQGATKLFENEHVIIWEQVGRPDPPVVHKHVRDIITIGLESGRIETRDAGGAKTDGKLETAVMSTLVYPAKGSPNQVYYSKAGLGPHAEVMTDKTMPGRSIQVEIKGTEPKDCGSWSAACK
jgi:hypothetical protein